MTRRLRQTSDALRGQRMLLLTTASPEAQARAIASMSPLDALKFDADFETWAHRNQLPPTGEGWRTWLMLAGRGFGKTRAGAEWICRLAAGKAGVRIALVGANIADARSVMVEGVSGILKVSRAHRRRVKWEPSLGRLTWPNGSVAELYSGDNADGLRGPEFDFAWFLTFEVIADDSDPRVDFILADAASGAIAAVSGDTVIGYAAYGQSIRSAAAPLVDAFGLELFDDGSVVRGRLSNVPFAVADGDLGNSADGAQVSRIQREQGSVRSVPAALRLAYYDPDRDFQSGEARASAGEQGGAERSSELPAVVNAASAKAIVHRNLARSWAQRDRLTLRLPPSFLGLEPGARVALPLSPAEWTVESCTIEGYVVAAELRPAVGAVAAIAAQGGRIAVNASAPDGPLTLALFESPETAGQADGSPTLMLAASSPGGSWRQRPLTLTVAGQSFAFLTARNRSVLGRALAVLPAGSPDLIDCLNSVEIDLINPDQWLTSCDDEALANGINLAMIGSEMLQFGQAVATGAGRFRLSRLLRGRGGTEWAIGAHQINDSFVLVGDGRSASLSLPQWVRGAMATAAPASGTADPAVAMVGGEALRPPAPAHLQGTVDAFGNLSLQWVRRSRNGWAWLDDVEAPLGESAEQYRVTVSGSDGQTEIICAEAQIDISAADIAVVGAGPASVEVRQVGDFAASRPASISIILS